MKRAVAFLLCTLFMGMAFAQSFVSEKLNLIATKAGIVADASRPKGYYFAGYYDNRSVCVGITADHRVFHVGYKLFSDNMKNQYPSEVYDFLERYLLELDCLGSEGIVEQYLSDDGVRIVEGSIRNAKHISTSTAFSFSLTDNKFYDIQWTEGSRTLLRMQFPVNFELLLGMRKSELENYMNEMLASESATFTPTEEVPTVDMLADGYFRSSPLVTYQLESLSTASYYERGDGDGLVPVYDDEHQEYSLRNLFRGLVANNYSLRTKQYLYGYKQKRFKVSLAQWLNYCRSKELRLYVDVSQKQDDADLYKVLIVAQSNALAYNHLLTVMVPKDFILTPNATLEATLNAFIPTHNIKNFYQEAVGK